MEESKNFYCSCCGVLIIGALVAIPVLKPMLCEGCKLEKEQPHNHVEQFNGQLYDAAVVIGVSGTTAAVSGYSGYSSLVQKGIRDIKIKNYSKIINS